MTSTDLKMTARTLVAAGKGILAADETLQIATKRLETPHERPCLRLPRARLHERDQLRAVVQVSQLSLPAAERTDD